MADRQDYSWVQKLIFIKKLIDTCHPSTGSFGMKSTPSNPLLIVGRPMSLLIEAEYIVPIDQGRQH